MLIGRQAIVIGAGIGGLTAAIALAQRGASVTVLEQADEIAEVGAGMQISPNGMAVFEAMGLASAVGQIGMPLSSVSLRDHAKGKNVVRMDVAAAKFAHPWLLVHRADLISVLSEAADAAGVQIELGVRVDGLVDEGRGGVALADGRTLRAGVIVAADGVRSEFRQIIDPSGAPKFRGQVAWRAVIPGDGTDPGNVSVFVGPGSHLVRYPLRGGRLINLVAVQERKAWAEEGWHTLDDPSVLRAAFRKYAPEVQSDLEKLRDVHLWGLFRRPVARRWCRGRVALLGDAAHATLPFMAQGAVMAVEDAWVLGECLSGSEGVEAGLALYEARRVARCRKVVAAADKNAWAYHLRMPGVRDLAHVGLGLGEKLRPGMALSRFDWIYRKDVTQPDP